MYILPLWLKAGIRMAVFLTKKTLPVILALPDFVWLDSLSDTGYFDTGYFVISDSFQRGACDSKHFKPRARFGCFSPRYRQKKQVAKCPTLSKHPWFELLPYTVRKIQWSPMELKSHLHLHSHKPWEKNCPVRDRFSFKNKGFCSPNSFSPGSGLNRQGNLEISLTR